MINQKGKVVVLCGSTTGKTRIAQDYAISTYIRSMPAMMENKSVWTTIQDRTPAQKDSFLRDRFMSSCRRCHEALTEGATYDEWSALAGKSGIEPALAHTAYDLVQKVIAKGFGKEESFPLSEG